MSRFQILCATMHQKNFSKIKEMNIHSDILFANQDDRFDFLECKYDGIHTARLITTNTRGVGKNRNIALLYADADICLLADDDIVYKDDVEDIVINEFNKYKDADVIIFHLDTDNPKKSLINYTNPKKYSIFMKKPWGSVRVAFRLNSIRKANKWFSTLFGGGTIFCSGEDSIFIQELINSGLNLMVTDKTIGLLKTDKSSWFTDRSEYYFYGKGALYQQIHSKSCFIWMLYFALRTTNMTELSFLKRLKWLNYGRKGYDLLLSYKEFKNRIKC